MIETNIRIIKGGTNFCLETKCASVQSQHYSPDLLQKACRALLKQYGLAAVPSPFTNKPELLVITKKAVPSMNLEGDDWLIQIEDENKEIRLAFSNPIHQGLLAELIEKYFISKINRLPHLWNFDSPRIWFQEKPFLTIDDISAYRRFIFLSYR